MRVLVSLVAGLIFGLGLVISGMANPTKVQNFLDIFGTWDPSLAFVMGGAIAIALPAFLLADRRSRPTFGESFSIPTVKHLDRRLIGGSVLFGTGWGLVGLCPGPAIVALTGSQPQIYTFFVFMVIGIAASKFITSTPKLVSAS